MTEQDWSAYNYAQQNEKPLFMRMLRELCDNLLDGGRKARPGNTFMDIRDMTFCMVMYIYCGKSSRRTVSELKIAQKMKYIKKAPHFNTILNYMNLPGMYSRLQHLLRISSLPLRQVESIFTVDASGFSSNKFGRWLDRGNRSLRDHRTWAKAHVISGVKTNIITWIEITQGTTADTKMFPDLVNNTGQYFDMKEVSADKAYFSEKNYSIVNSYGALPFIPFKKNVNPDRVTHSAIWHKMWELFNSNRDIYDARYHKRSNSETIFSMMKLKFSSHVRMRNIVGQRSELVSMGIAHNICVLIQEMFELGIEVDFEKCAKNITAQH